MWVKLALHIAQLHRPLHETVVEIGEDRRGKSLVASVLSLSFFLFPSGDTGIYVSIGAAKIAKGASVLVAVSLLF
jgi:hypothetical protein